MAASIFGFATPARANLTIDATFGTTITSDPNAATIETGIDQAISRLEADILNPVTVNIDFEETNTGLGESETYIGTLPYSSYTSVLTINQIPSANDVSAIASLPASPSAVNGNASAGVTATLPLFRALQVSNANPPAGEPDGTISLNMSIINISRASTNPSFYDLQAVAGHEMDEILGAGGSGSELPTLGGNIGPLDLFRFSAPGTRSYTTSTSATPYFSINGGVTDFVHFNQAGGGSDYADWGDGVSPADGTGNTPPQLQDAFGTPGAQVNIGGNELAALDVIGWNLTPAGTLLETKIPEPASCTLLALGAAGFLARRRHAAI